MLETQHLTKYFNRRQVVKEVSFTIRPGEIVGYLGPNGAGKTTSLKTISGIIDPSKGQIRFDGEEIQRRDPSWIVRRGIGHVPEGREVFPLLSVHDNLMMGGYTRDDRDALQHDLSVVYGYFPILKERDRQNAGLLSGGQQQMLAQARALMDRPRLLLLDEPTLGLA